MINKVRWSKILTLKCISRVSRSSIRLSVIWVNFSTSPCISWTLDAMFSRLAASIMCVVSTFSCKFITSFSNFEIRPFTVSNSSEFTPFSSFIGFGESVGVSLGVSLGTSLGISLGISLGSSFSTSFISVATSIFFLASCATSSSCSFSVCIVWCFWSSLVTNSVKIFFLEINYEIS